MYIHEAIKETNEYLPCIRRSTEEWEEMEIRILPTNTCECCVISSKVSRGMRGWQPTKADLLADDWILCWRD